jgi:hypothetical protein
MEAVFDVQLRALQLHGLDDPGLHRGGDLAAVIASPAWPVALTGVRFGVECRVNGEITTTEEWPANGIRYKQTDQRVLESYRLTWSPGADVEIFAWLIDAAGQRHEAAHSFVAPLPLQPYPSWTWGGEFWEPPVPYPDDEAAYDWDEELQAWIPVELPPP